MAKSRRPKANDTPGTNAARPRAAGRRRGDRQPTTANDGPGSSPDPAPETPEQSQAQDLAASAVTQESSPPQIERDEPAPSEPSEHEIRVRAYLLYLDRGAFDGADIDDWLQAEIELKKR